MVKLMLAGYLALFIGFGAIAAPLLAAAHALAKVTEVRK